MKKVLAMYYVRCNVTAVTEFGILLKTNGLHMHRSDTENIVKLQFKE
jgi:hypothetical protein